MGQRLEYDDPSGSEGWTSALMHESVPMQCEPTVYDRGCLMQTQQAAQQMQPLEHDDPSSFEGWTNAWSTCQGLMYETAPTGCKSTVYDHRRTMGIQQVMGQMQYHE